MLRFPESARVVIKTRMNLPPKLILVATDLSNASQPALEAAAFYGTQHGSKIVLCHVFDPTPFAAPTLLPGPNEVLEEAAAEMTAQAEKNLEALASESLQGCQAEATVLRHASPGEAIAEHATKISADLVVVGSHGRTGLRRILLGSVAERVVRLAKCPVLVVRPNTA